MGELGKGKLSIASEQLPMYIIVWRVRMLIVSFARRRENQLKLQMVTAGKSRFIVDGSGSWSVDEL